MVNRGRSKGCHNCKRRRIKCDETKPNCQRCARVKAECEGYEPRKTIKIRFKDQNMAMTRRSSPGQRHNSKLVHLNQCQYPIYNISGSLPPDEESLAFGFFLNSFVTTGQNVESSGGLFENITPALTTARVESPVYLAFSAVATQMFSQWHRGTIKSSRLPKVRLIQALKRLQRALLDPVESVSHETLVATLLLQFQDNVASVRHLQRGSRTHLNGALALIRHQNQTNPELASHKYILLRIINVEVSSAMREGRSVAADLRGWYDWNSMPRTETSDLDRIGISVADLQRIFTQTWHHHSQCIKPFCPHFGVIAEICAQAKRAEEKLRSWASRAPKSWIPSSFDLGCIRGNNPPVQTYLGTCDIYPSIQIASLWNALRSYRLVIMNILLACGTIYESSGLAGSLFLISTSIDKVSIRSDIRGSLDSICATVPYYLGNRIRRCTLEDFSDTTLDFPAYHSSLRKSPGLSDVTDNCTLISCVNHDRHTITQGPWHIINFLSRVLSLCSGPIGASLTTAMRDEQLAWVQEQFLRCVTILGLENHKFDHGDLLAEKHCTLLSDNLNTTLGR